MNPKCIIFDCDGVLVDSEEITNRVLVEMGNALGIDLDFAYASEQFTGSSLRSIFDWMEDQLDRPLPANFEQDFRAKTFDLFRTEIKPIPGVRELLDQVTVPVCVASSGPLNKMELNLTTTELIDKFDGNLFSCYQIGKWKPDPAIFLHAASTMGFEPEECVVIEDSISGVRAAKRGGFTVCAYVGDRDGSVLTAEGAIVFRDMGALVELIGKI